MRHYIFDYDPLPKADWAAYRSEPIGHIDFGDYSDVPKAKADFAAAVVKHHKAKVDLMPQVKFIDAETGIIDLNTERGWERRIYMFIKSNELKKLSK